jgi:hypothetical protein
MLVERAEHFSRGAQPRAFAKDESICKCHAPLRGLEGVLQASRALRS